MYNEVYIYSQKQLEEDTKRYQEQLKTIEQEQN